MKPSLLPHGDGCNAEGGSGVPPLELRAPPFYGPFVDKPRTAAALGILAAGLAAYANTFRVPFVFDDTASITDNPTLGHWSTLFFPPHGGGLTVEGRPFLNASFAFNRWLSGSAVWSYHAVNLAIHLGAALLLFALLRRALPLIGAFAAALLWTVHPLSTEAVTYVAQRGECLASALCFLTLWAFARGCERRSRAWFALSIGACFVGMGVKEIMYAAPLLVLLYDRAFISGSLAEAWRRHGKVHWALWACLLPLALFIAGAGSRGHTVGAGAGVAWWPYVENQVPAVLHYLRLCLWPTPLIFDYGTFQFAAGSVLFAAIVVVGLLLLTLIGLSRWPRLAFLGCVFFLILAPTSLIPGNRQTLAEHRMYLPLAAVVALVVEAASSPLLGRTEAARRRFHLLLIVLAIPLGVATIARNATYRTNTFLYADTVAKLPNNAFAHFDLGKALREKADWSGAATQYRATLTLNPGMVRAATDLGFALNHLRDWPGAEAAYRQSLALYPNDAAVRYALGQVLQHEGRAADAAEQFNDAQLLDPTGRYRQAAP